MATAFTHAFVAVAFGRAAFPRNMPWTFWPIAMACSALPDLDVARHTYGVKYGDPWGHRGLTHSLAFAAVLSLTVVSWVYRNHARRFSHRWWALLTFFFLITASHGFLDAFTDGGHGVAFFAPFDNTRYFMLWRPLYVSPLGVHDVFTPYFADVMLSELLWVWLPTLAITAPIILWCAWAQVSRNHAA